MNESNKVSGKVAVMSSRRDFAGLLENGDWVGDDISDRVLINVQLPLSWLFTDKTYIQTDVRCF